MNIEKAEKLFSLMRQYGIEHFKDETIEVKLSNAQVPQKVIEPQKEKKVSGSKKGDIDKKRGLDIKSIPLQAAPPVENTIPHHVNEVAQLLKLSDNDLVDKLFPDYTQRIS